MEKTLIKIEMDQSHDTVLTIKGSDEALTVMFASAMYHDKTLKEIVTNAAMLCAMRQVEEENKSRLN